VFSFFKRRNDVRIAVSRQEPFARRHAAIWALAETADPTALAALRQIATGPDELELRRAAIGRLANMSRPDAIRALLALLATESTGNTWVFIDVHQGLSWNTIALGKLGDEGVPPLVMAGRNVLAWKRATAGERSLQAKWLRDIRAIVEKLGTPAARSASADLNDRLQRLRAPELPRLLKIALESNDFEEAESTIAEIAELGTAEARLALAEIRQQPSRYLDHHFETDNTDVETGYSPKWVTLSRPSSELGETLAGEARARWDSAKPR
jgi:HEAT repeat protein